jgi:hypothetical protein
MYALIYNLPNNKSFAFAPRSGTSSLGAASVQRFFPEKWTEQTDGMAHRVLPFTINDQFNNCILIIRNPIDRFISLCARTGTSPNDALAKLYWSLGFGSKRIISRSHIEHTTVDWLYHYSPLSSRIGDNCKLIPFQNLSEAAIELELYKLPHINAVKNKPMLTKSEIEDIHQIYNKDIILWESLC